MLCKLNQLLICSTKSTSAKMNCIQISTFLIVLLTANDCFAKPFRFKLPKDSKDPNRTRIIHLEGYNLVYEDSEGGSINVNLASLLLNTVLVISSSIPVFTSSSGNTAELKTETKIGTNGIDSASVVVDFAFRP